MKQRLRESSTDLQNVTYPKLSHDESIKLSHGESMDTSSGADHPNDPNNGQNLWKID